MPVPPDLDAETLGTLRAGVRLMALRRLGDADQADDAAQETLARALAALREGRAGDIQSLGAFVHGIARHVIADILRARPRHQGGDALERVEDPRSSRDALSLAVSAEEHQRVRAALARLSGDDRRLLQLCFYEGLSPGEAAERLGEPVLRVRKRKSRALQRLREVFLGAARGHASAGGQTMDGARNVVAEPGVSA